MISIRRRKQAAICRHIVAVVISLSLCTAFLSHVPSRNINIINNRRSQDMIILHDNQSSFTSDTTLPNPNDMRLKEIKEELTTMHISYADCFDKESLVKRLIEARDGLVLPDIPEVDKEEDTKLVEDVDKEPTSTTTESIPTSATTEPDEEFDRESTLTELRSLRVKELKERLSKFGVRWGTMVEKSEMVESLCNAMEERHEQSKNFSRSGELVPGTVTDVDERTLLKELGWLESDLNRGVATTTTSSDDDMQVHPPILLDVYATWCGPCQFVAPLLVEAAEELGPSVRVVKLDSDKYPRISSVLKVGGLPTLIRFDGGDISKEVQRIEGALTKDQMIEFAQGNLNR